MHSIMHVKMIVLKMYNTMKKKISTLSERFQNPKYAI